jgi:hypothetical protein
MDVDGVLADFRSSFRALATSELGLRGSSGDESNLSKGDVDRLWKAVGRIANWWTNLGAYEPEQITRLYDLSRKGRWEVFFVTSRPPSGGDAVQMQTQVWLEHHGFYLPTVLTAPAGARGELSRSLRLDLMVDDHLINCMEIVGASNTKVLHMARGTIEDAKRQQAETRGIGVVNTLAEALDCVERFNEMLVARQGRLVRLGDWFFPKKQRQEPVLPYDPRQRR